MFKFLSWYLSSDEIGTLKFLDKPIICSRDSPKRVQQSRGQIVFPPALVYIRLFVSPTRLGDRDDLRAMHPKHQQWKRVARQMGFAFLSARAGSLFHPIFHDDSRGYPTPVAARETRSTIHMHTQDEVASHPVPLW